MDAPQVKAKSIRVGLFWVVLAWLLRPVGLLLWWLVRQPVLWILAASAGAAWWLSVESSPSTLAVAGAGLAVLLVVWRLAHRASFCRVIAWPLRAWWRRWFVYGRQWEDTLANLKLAEKNSAGERLVPRLLRVRSTATVDKVRVEMLPGQVLSDFASNAHRLAATFEALDCRVRSVPRPSLRRWLFGLVQKVRPSVEVPPVLPSRRLDLWFLVNDPLTKPVELFPVPARPNLTALPVALREDGLAWTLRLLATHLLIIGVTGAGKGSLLWSIIRALGHGIRTRLVELWVLDPKGGMEFAAGQRLFTRYCYGDDNPDTEGESGEGSKTTKRAEKKTGYEWSFVEFLEEAVRIMRDRQGRLRGILRTHKPAPGDPLIVVVIDELASLTAYVTDRDAKKRIEAALNLLLSQGRAVGISVIAAAQDARKEVVDMRGLFPSRLALRLSEPDEVDLVLRKGTRDKGARCDEIPEDMPGTAFVTLEGVNEPLRVRFGYIDDTEIQTMCSLFAPGTAAPHALAEPSTSRLHVVHGGESPSSSVHDKEREKVAA